MKSTPPVSMAERGIHGNSAVATSWATTTAATILLMTGTPPLPSLAPPGENHSDGPVLEACCQRLEEPVG